MDDGAGGGEHVAFGIEDVAAPRLFFEDRTAGPIYVTDQVFTFQHVEMHEPHSHTGKAEENRGSEKNETETGGETLRHS